MIKHISVIFIVLTLASLTGCASIVNGTNQSVSVNTGDAGNASCMLQNNKGTWYVNGTPGSVTVNRSFGDLSVDCKKSGLTGHKLVASHTKGMAFGNVLFGGVIGAGVDMADGAAYDYPSDIFVPMRRA